MQQAYMYIHIILILVCLWNFDFHVAAFCEHFDMCNSSLISFVLIGLFSSAIRVQTDNVLIYASFQVQLSAVKLSNV